MKTLFVFLLYTAINTQSLAQIIHVPQDYTKIQLAINAAQDGDTIVVDRGKYFENIDFKGKGITLTSNYIFSKDVQDIDSTIIDGSQPVNPDSASCVLMYKPNQSFFNDTSAALIGFTLMGGNGTAWEDEHNLGSYYREGGGILIQYWAPRILFNVIKDNEAYNKTGLTSAGGGAIRCGDANPTIANNIFYHNRGRYGAGIVLNYAGAIIKNNIIAYNYGGEDYAGSGIWILGNRSDNKIKVIENNTIVYNSSVLSGGGIYLWSSNGNYIRNNIIYGNTAPSNPQIRSQGSTGQIIYNDVEGGYAGEGNINLYPEFTQQGYYLNDNSPCIDTGKDSAVFNDPSDPLSPGKALFPSKGTIRNDIGAFGGPFRTDLPQIITSIHEISDESIPDQFKLFQNYPNPFNPSTKISWQSPVSSWQTLKVYDILGNEVATLVNEEKPAGSYNVEFTINNVQLSSGIYFYRLQAGSYVETKKMVLLK